MKQIFNNFKKQKTVSLLSIFSLSLGIMVAIVVGLWSLHKLSFDQFHENKDRIYRIISHWPMDGEMVKIGMSYKPLGEDAKEALPAIEELCRVVILSDEMNPGLNINDVWHLGTRIFSVDPNFFTFFSFPLLVGAPEQVLSTPDRVVISESAAARYFPQQNPVGQSLKLSNLDFTISGVMKDMPINSSLHADFVFPFFPFLANDSWGGNTIYNHFLQLHKNIRAEDLHEPLLQVFEAGMPGMLEAGVTISLESLNDMHFSTDLQFEFIDRKGNKSLIMIFAFTALAILIISCINFANMFVSTSFIRAKMTGIKKCMGADSNLIMREFYLETSFYVLVSLVLGILLAVLLLPVFNDFTQSELNIAFVSLHLYALLAVIFIFTVLLAGSFPALYVSRFNILDTISGQFKAQKASIFQKSLAVFQFATAIALLIVVAFMQKQVNYIISYNLGFDKEHVVFLQSRGNFDRDFNSFKSELL